MDKRIGLFAKNKNIQRIRYETEDENDVDDREKRQLWPW